MLQNHEIQLKPLLGKIAYFAFYKMKELLLVRCTKYARDKNLETKESCSDCSVVLNFGLPCTHILGHLVLNDLPIDPDMIHRWHVDYLNADLEGIYHFNKPNQDRMQEA